MSTSNLSAKVNGRMTVTILMTDPNALAMPSDIEFKKVKGMAIFIIKLMLGGKFEDVLDTVKSNYKHLGEIIN